MFKRIDLLVKDKATIQKKRMLRGPMVTGLKKSKGTEAAQKSVKQAKPLRIGAVARQLGISASMIRAWERLGLRREATKEGSHRLYDQADVELLCRAVYLRRSLGLNAPAILAKLHGEGLLGRGEVQSAEKGQLTGKLLRELRLARGLSLAEVAKAAEISTGFLSNLERSQTGVSLGIMHRLAHYYGTTLSAFYYEAESPGPLIRRGEGRPLAGGDGVQMELLAWGKIVMEPHLFTIEPGKGSMESYAHHGEEFLHLISGKLNITLDGKEYQLKQGDSFYFASKTRHSWINPAETPATVLWINTSAVV
jgi:transcriptional regulator with XRE-family HTH domain